MSDSTKRRGSTVGFRGTIEERFWAKVEKRDDGCWIWTASRNQFGYGTFWNTKKVVAAHRWLWETTRGPIPEGMVLDHDNLEFGCGNPSCVNPDHLELVEQITNVRRGRHLKKNNSSGHRGVRWSKKDRRWRVRVRYMGKEIGGGGYLSLEDAIAARDALHIQLYGDVMHEKEHERGA